MGKPFAATFLFKDKEHFEFFMEQCQIESFTYNLKKKEYMVDLSQDISTSISSKPPAAAQETPSVPPKQDVQVVTMTSDFL